MKPRITNKQKQKDFDFICAVAQNYANNIKKDVYVFEQKKDGIGICYDFSEEKTGNIKRHIKYDRGTIDRNVLQNNGDKGFNTIKPKKSKSKPRTIKSGLG